MTGALVAQILAASRENSWIVPAVAVAIWLISAVVNAVKKAQELQRRNEVRVKLEASLNMPPPIPKAAKATLQQRPVMQARQTLQQRQPQQRQPQQRQPVRQPQRQPAPIRKTVKPPPVVSRAAQPVAEPGAREDISATEIGSEKKKQPQSGATAAALNRWLTPATLRQQFILTEILQPPTALRQRQY